MQLNPKSIPRPTPIPKTRISDQEINERLTFLAQPRGQSMLAKSDCQ